MSKPVVYIVLYSLYHHVYKLALSIQEGLESKGIEVQLFQVAETLSDDILNKMQAPSKPDIPIITVDKLAEPDGLLFGLPTRFGIFPAQIKNLLDASGALWAKGALVGKFAGTFFATASQHGGQETTALTAVTYFAHQGMLYVPFGFADPALSNNDEVIGGSAYGAGTITNGDGSRQPSHLELQVAKHQGENFGALVRDFVKGKQYGAQKEVATESVNHNNGTTDTTAAGVAAAGAGAAATTGTGTTAAPMTNKDATTTNNSSLNNGAGVVDANRTDTGANMTTATADPNNTVAGDNTTTANANAATTKDTTTNTNNTTAATNASTANNAATDTSGANHTTTGAAGATGAGLAATAAAAGGKTSAKTNNATSTTITAQNSSTDVISSVNPKDKASEKIGKNAGEKAAGATNSVPTLKDNTPKKKSKWFCCF